MTYTQQGERVTIEMTREDYDGVTLMLGTAFGMEIKLKDDKLAYRWLALANELNATNPNWTPYEIPEEHRG